MQPINDKQHPEGQTQQQPMDERETKHQVRDYLIVLGVILADEGTRQQLIDEDLERRIKNILIKLGVIPADEEKQQRIRYEEEMRQYVMNTLIKFGAVPADEQTRQKLIDEDLERRIKNILTNAGVTAAYKDADAKTLSEKQGGGI